MENELILKQEISQDFNNLKQNFINYLDVSVKTQETYLIALNQFWKYLKSKDIVNPKRDDILQFKRELIEKHYSANTIQSYLIAIRNFFKWCSSMGLYLNIAENIKGVKVDKKHKKDSLNQEQIKKLIDSIESVRDKALISLMLTTGIRGIELERAKVEDLKQIEGYNVLMIQRKGHIEKDNYVVLSNEVYTLLKNYIGARSKNSPLFISESTNGYGQSLSLRSIRGIVKKHFRNIGLDSNRLSAHSLRHTFATQSLKNGANIIEVSNALGHSSLSTTQIYLEDIQAINNPCSFIMNDIVFKGQ